MLSFFAKEALRIIPEKRTEVFLSFDDGPDRECTEKLLNLLDEKKAKASFFLVADKLQYHSDLVQRILRNGHAIGNHSLDHKYGSFFSGRQKMLQWIKESQKIFTEHGLKCTFFRPPAGLCTPELLWALKKEKLKLALWSYRFFDSTLPLSSKKIKKAVKRLQGGEIILLHERCHFLSIDQQLEKISELIDCLKLKGFQLSALPTKK